MVKIEVYVCVVQRMLVEGGAAGRSEIDRETRYCWWGGGAVLHNGRNPGRITQKGRPNFSCFFCKSAEKGAFAILEMLFIKKMAI